MAILGTALAVEKAPGQEVESWAFGKGYRKGRDWGGLRNPFGESACPRAMACLSACHQNPRNPFCVIMSANLQ